MERWIEFIWAENGQPYFVRASRINTITPASTDEKNTAVSGRTGRSCVVVGSYTEIRFLITAPLWQIWTRKIWRWIRRARNDN